MNFIHFYIVMILLILDLYNVTITNFGLDHRILGQKKKKSSASYLKFCLSNNYSFKATLELGIIIFSIAKDC